jgi:hypothetical protein
MQGILENTFNADLLAKNEKAHIGRKIGIIGTLFGCWHKRLTRPFSEQNVSYRACLECGARREFNPQSFKSSGPFYFPPSVKPDVLANS